MTKRNDQRSTPSACGSVTTLSEGIIVQHQPVTEQQHFVLSPVNNAAPMIITTPLAAPSIITQKLPTTAPNNAQQPTVTTIATPTVGAVNTTITNKTTAKPTTQERLVCSLCNKVYRSSAGLRYHKRKRHRDEGMLKAAQLHRVRCLENGCTYQMLAISDLRNHLANHHLKPEYKTTEEKKFNSFTEFTEWKAAFEQSSGSKYVKNCGSKGKSENQTTEYYYCNRTGLYKQTRQGWRRNSKAHDSIRCGIHCTSSMKVDIARNDQISVQYYPTHYGHTAEPPLQVPAAVATTNSTITTNGELVEQSSVQKQTIPPIQTVVQSAVQQQQTTTDHCVRLQHQHHTQTSSIIINIAPIGFVFVFFILIIMTKKGSSAASSPAASVDNNAASVGRFVCSMCAKVYRSGAGLRYHKRKRHRGMVEPTALHRVKCQEIGCTYQMLAISDLRNHLSNHHQKPEYKCTEEKKFTSVADFTEWKSSFETNTGSKYVKNCGAKGKSDNQTTEYYYCNRTGPFGQGLRRNKAQGSLRGGIHCTSSMKVEIQNDEHITVQYYPAHYGHSNLPASDEPQNLSENSTTITGANIHHQQHHQQQDNSQHGADRSSSSSPGSSSTSPSGGSNSNSNHPTMNIERQSMIPTHSFLKNNNTNINTNVPNNNNNNNNTMNHSMQNQMSHCIIISPSFMMEENVSTNSNHHHTPVFVVQQHLPPSSNAIISPPTNLPIKKEKCVSDIMHEAFQLLSYWPLDHHHGIVTSENEQQIPQPRFNMDEHLMF